MRGVGDGAYGLSDHVDFPVLRLSAAYEGVECPGRRPHDVRARLVVHRAGYGDAARGDKAAHERFGKEVARVVVGAGEVLLGDVVHDVEDARDHLIARHRVGELGIQHGEMRRDALVGEDVTDFKAKLSVGDDRAAVHLGASAHHGEDGPHGHDLPICRGFLESVEVYVPGVFACGKVLRDGDRLRVVDARAAAYGEDEIDIVLSSDSRSLAKLLDGGVRHDAAVFDDVLPSGAKRIDNLVVNAKSPDGSPTVDELDGVAVGGELRCQRGEGVFAED